MKDLLLICCLGLVIPFTAAAKLQSEVQKPLNLSQVKALAGDYYLQKQLKAQRSSQTFTLNRAPICDPIPEVGSCVDSICSKLPSYQCDDSSELQEIARACGNSFDGSCVAAVCSKLPSYQCDDRSEMIEIAKSCSGYTSGKCIQSVCSRLPSYQCDDASELKQVAESCSGLIDGSCVDSVCSHLPSYQCDDLSELKEIAKSCKHP